MDVDVTTTPMPSPASGTDLTPLWIGLAAAAALIGLAIVVFAVVRASRRRA